MQEFKLGIYRHFKGNLYKALYVALDSETLEEMVVYKALYGEGKIWVRPLAMWNQTVEDKEGNKVKRFEFLSEN